MTDEMYSPFNSALLLIDVVNDMLADDGKNASQLGPMLARLDVKRALQRLLHGARAAGLKVFYVKPGIDEHSFAGVPALLPSLRRAIDGKIMWKGTYGAEFYPPLRPQVGDLVTTEHRQFNGFMGTNLETLLRENRIEKVILAGLTSHTTVEGTGRHAMENGYHVTFLKDAVADFTEAAHRGAVELSFPSFGHRVLTVDEFLGLVDVTAGSEHVAD